jgi:hypothetical protein
MFVKNILKSGLSGKAMDKLVGFLARVKDGQVSQNGMMAMGFDLSNPSNNNESVLMKEMSIRMNIPVDEIDLRNALAEVGAKSASDIVQEWLMRNGQHREAPVQGKLGD